MIIITQYNMSSKNYSVDPFYFNDDKSSLYITKLISFIELPTNEEILSKLESKINNYKTLLKQISNDSQNFIKINKSDYCDELFIDCVKENGYTIQYIAQELRTNEIMLEAVKQNAHSIKYITQEYKANEMMLIAVMQFGSAIQHIAQEFRTNDIMLAA